MEKVLDLITGLFLSSGNKGIDRLINIGSLVFLENTKKRS